MNARLSFSASVAIDHETKTVGSTATLNATSVTSGKQTVGTSYEMLATADGSTQAIILHNTGAVDVSVRVDLQTFTTNEYICMLIPPDGLLVVPAFMFGDAGITGPNNNILCRAASGTVDIDYCIVR